MGKPILLDTTLRDGEQTPGVYFTNREKLYIASELSDIGIEIIEAGIPSMGEEERKSLKAIKKLNLKSEILSWNRLLIEDVIASLRAGIRTIHLSVPTSDVMIEKKMGKTRDWIIPEMEKVFNFALKEGAVISFGAEDASRTESRFLKQIFVTAQLLGAKRVRFADTLGIMTPSQIADQLKYLSKDLDIAIDYHGHNDFGMATANALAAWENGADVISCSVLGLGERAGNTSLEEFACIMQYLKNQIRDFDFVRLKKLCQAIAEWTDCPIPDRKPVVGKKIFTHESGIHVDGILKEPTTYELLPPEFLGGNRAFILGKHSGLKAVRYFANNEGYEISDDLVDDFLKGMRSQMAQTKGINASSMFDNFLKLKGKK
jgi:Isopropylmalate/homocitrate/citramalate synthases